MHFAFKLRTIMKADNKRNYFKYIHTFDDRDSSVKYTVSLESTCTPIYSQMPFTLYRIYFFVKHFEILIC